MTVNINAANISSVQLAAAQTPSAPNSGFVRLHHNANSRLAMRPATGNVVEFLGNTSGSGAGITFPATQSPSSDANTLDDYEEGTWTVRVADAATGGNLSATTATGQYTIIGRFIEYIFSIGPISTSGLTGANQLYIRGFPFDWDIIAVRGQGSIATENVTYTGNISLEAIGGAGACRIVESNSNAAWTTITVSDLTATTATLQGRISGII